MSNISDDQALEALLSSAQSKEQTRDHHHHQNNNRNRNHNHNRGRNTTTTKKRFNDDSTSNHNYRNNDRYGNNNRGGGSGGSGRGGGRGGGGGGRDDYYRPRNDDGRDGRDGRDRDINSNNRNDNGNRSYQNKRQRRFNNRKDEEKEDSKYSWGDNNNNKNNDDNEEDNDNEDTRDQNNVPEEKANFGLSGALQEDETTGNTYNGIVLKFSEPPEARTPNTRWRLYVFKKKSGDDDDNKKDNGGLLQTLHISKQSAYLFGRERKVADIPVDHPSLSKQHCVLQYRSLPDKNDREQRLRCKPYLMDLGSTNGTFINGVRIEDARYYELRKGDVITLGASTREYVLLTENTTSSDL